MFPKKGNVFPAPSGPEGSEAKYAVVVAMALRQNLGHSHQAVKTVVRWTGASDRTVKNGFAATSGPSGEYLVALTRNSDEVFQALLMMAGRDGAIASASLLDIRCKLAAALEFIDSLIDSRA
jgi:hypothetical protein